MKTKVPDNAGTKNRKLDILLIEDDVTFSNGRKVTIEEGDGTTIIMTHSEESAIDVLRIVAVDVIYNYRAAGSRLQAQEFRDHVAEQYPSIRLVDLWTPSRTEGEKGNILLPLYLREGLACDARRSMWRDKEDTQHPGLPKPSIDRECAGVAGTQPSPPDDRAA